MDGGLQTSSEHTHILQQGITKNQMCAHREPVSEKKKNQICKYIMLHLSLRAPQVKILPRYVWFGKETLKLSDASTLV